MPGPDDILQRMLQQNPVVRNNPNNAPILNALLQQAKAFLGLP